MAGHDLDLTAVGVLGRADPRHLPRVARRIEASRSWSSPGWSRCSAASSGSWSSTPQPVRVPASDEERFLSDFAPQSAAEGGARLRRPIRRAARSGRADAGTDRVVRARAPGPAGLGGALRRRAAGSELSARRSRPTGSALAIRGPRRPCSRPCRCRTRRFRSSPPSATRCRRARPRTRLLDGVAAWVFVEQVLPRLTSTGSGSTQAGEVVDYRRSEAEPAIAVSAVERRDSADWFDLHLTVSMDGETVPFDELFVALAAGAGPPDPGDRRLLRARPARVRAAPRPDRGVQGAAGPRASRADDQPFPGEPVGRPGRSRRGRSTSRPAWSRIARGLSDVTSIDPVPAPGQRCWPSCARTSSTASAGCNFLHAHQLGGILADDMGLGKTLQALALICHAVAGQPDGPAVPGRRPDQRGVQLGQRGGPVRPRT